MNETNKTQEKALEQVACRNFIIGTVDGDGYFSISTRPCFHATKALALQECARLSLQHPGKAFVAMQLTGGSMLPAIVRTRSL